MNKFDLEQQYQLYLKRVALNEKAMHPEQTKQLRQTFMGACGVMLMLLREDLAELEEKEAIEKLESMTDQVREYFVKVTFPGIGNIEIPKDRADQIRNLQKKIRDQRGN